MYTLITKIRVSIQQLDYDLEISMRWYFYEAEFPPKKQCLFLVFRNNFGEITNTSLFLLKQLDYSF